MWTLEWASGVSGNLSYNGDHKAFSCSAELLRHWFGSSSELSKWLESHPQREDIYAALRPCWLNDLIRIEHFLMRLTSPGIMRSAQIEDLETLQALSAER